MDVTILNKSNKFIKILLDKSKIKFIFYYFLLFLFLYIKII